ncbi:LexA family protein [Streptomyces sp. NPDC096013]|uniref:LexA family protein n=1 Tax=Streptomyces sp. NPDC096013 TaxID=3366069 RepID=UPI0037F18504
MGPHTFPLDLIQAQRDLNRVYASLERRPVHTAPLRRRLQALLVRLAAHPYWETTAGRDPSAKVALKERVRDLDKAESGLTDRQERILDCIRSWVIEHGAPPTQHEIATSVGLASTGSVSYQIAQLEKAGVIRLDASRRIALRW